MKCYKKDYPRPQFVRDNWVNLNGTWDFGFDDANQGEKEKWYEKFPGELKIEVPFTYETKLSGIQDERRHDNIWYHKTITVDASKLTDNRLLIQFRGQRFPHQTMGERRLCRRPQGWLCTFPLISQSL